MSKNVEMKNLFVIILVSFIISGCSQSSNEKQTVTQEEEPTIQKSLNIESSNTISKNWEFLLDSRWYILLKDSINGQRKYIEPACLSTSGFIGFRGEGGLEKLVIGCGQDVLEFKIISIEKHSLTLKINYADNGRIEIVDIESTEKYPYKRITVRIKNIDELLLGYYPDNILALNKLDVVYTIDKNGNFEFLRENGLYTKLHCDEEEEEY